MPLESEILASLRTFDATRPPSGMVSENLLIATTSVLILASLPLTSLTSAWICSARAWKFKSFIFRALVDGVVSDENLAYCLWDAYAVSVNCQAFGGPCDLM